MPAAQKSQRSVKKVPPLGLTLAIVLAALIYGLGPLVPVILELVITARALSSGVTTGGIQHQDLIPWANVAYAAVVLVLCVFAWRGRPRWGRWALVIVVWLVTFFQMVALITSGVPTPTNASEIVGGDFSVWTRPYQICTGMLLIAIPLYMTWFMNRAPARAYYQDR